jgi:hypothetical protein
MDGDFCGILVCTSVILEGILLKPNMILPGIKMEPPTHLLMLICRDKFLNLQSSHASEKTVSIFVSKDTLIWNLILL